MPLTVGVYPVREAIIGLLYQDFVFNTSSDFMQVELAARVGCAHLHLSLLITYEESTRNT